MTVVVYGKSAAAFVEPVVGDLQRAATARGAEITALPIETAVRMPTHWGDIARAYVLPFDVPLALPAELPVDPAALLRTLLPNADIINACATHELTWDKLASARRLLERGLPMPESLVTSDPKEATDFVRRHQQAILKETRSCGGHGHVVLLADADGTIAGEVPGRRYAVELAAAGIGRRLEHGVLTVPPPFYVQRLVTAVGRAGVLRPAQVLRAYVVDGRLVFWTERYRERYRRPADFIISTTFGARYRFLSTVSDEAQTIARRAAEALGVRVGVVDLIRGSEGVDVLEVDTDGQHMMIDRSFKALPEYRQTHDFDRYIAELLTAPAAAARVTVTQQEGAVRGRPRPPRPTRRPPRPARPPRRRSPHR